MKDAPVHVASPSPSHPQSPPRDCDGDQNVIFNEDSELKVFGQDNVEDAHECRSAIPSLPSSSSADDSGDANMAPIYVDIPPLVKRRILTRKTSKRRTSSSSGSTSPGNSAGENRDFILQLAKTVLLKNASETKLVDSNSAFAAYVGCCLREMDPYAAAMAKVEIQKILLKYHRNNPVKPSLVLDN